MRSTRRSSQIRSSSTGCERKEELSRLSEYELDLLSSDRAIKLDDVLGKNVTVKLELADDKVRSFSGYVTRIAQVGMHGRYHAYRATVRPWLWFLTRTTNCRIFQEKTVPDILKEVFATAPGRCRCEVRAHGVLHGRGTTACSTAKRTSTSSAG